MWEQSAGSPCAATWTSHNPRVPPGSRVLPHSPANLNFPRQRCRRGKSWRHPQTARMLGRNATHHFPHHDRTGSVVFVRLAVEGFAAANDAAPNPWFSWQYLQGNWNDITTALTQHINLTWQAVAIAFVLALPLALRARRVPQLQGWTIGAAGGPGTVPWLARGRVLGPLTGIGGARVGIAQGASARRV